MAKRLRGLFVLALLVLPITACSSTPAALPPPCSLLTNAEASAIIGSVVIGNPSSGAGQGGRSEGCTFSAGSVPNDRTLAVQEQQAQRGSEPGQTVVVDGVAATWIEPATNSDQLPHRLRFYDSAGNLVSVVVSGIPDAETAAKATMSDILRRS
jgi:hypothetical protein